MTHAWQPTTVGETSPPRSILILEDNETLALGLRTSLEVEGYKVDCVIDGDDGLRWLEQHDPDLIVLDLMLPGTNGFEVLRRYRARGGTAAVLILSARGQKEEPCRSIFSPTNKRIATGATSASPRLRNWRATSISTTPIARC